MKEQKFEGKKEKSKTRHRSPAYPAISIEEAIRKAEDLYREEQFNFTPVEVILKHWGYSKGSGSGLLVLSALLKYGLLIDEGTSSKRKAKLTELAKKIIKDERPDSQDRLDAIREAALKPPIHNEFWEKYGGSLGSDSNLKHDLTFDKEFSDLAAKRFIEELRATWDYAKLINYDSISQEEKDKRLGESEKTMLNVQTTSPDVQGEQKVRSIMKKYSLPVKDGNLADVVFWKSEIDEEDVEYLIEGLGLLKKTLKKKPEA
jgi:hypothetical protein